MKKVTLTKQQAEALEQIRELYDDEVIIEISVKSFSWSGSAEPLNEVPLLKLCEAIVNGYDSEQTPEEKLAEIHQDYRKSRPGSLLDAQADGISEALITLGIEIEGINK